MKVEEKTRSGAEKLGICREALGLFGGTRKMEGERWSA